MLSPLRQRRRRLRLWLEGHGPALCALVSCAGLDHNALQTLSLLGVQSNAGVLRAQPSSSSALAVRAGHRRRHLARPTPASVRLPTAAAAAAAAAASGACSASMRNEDLHRTVLHIDFDSYYTQASAAARGKLGSIVRPAAGAAGAAPRG